MCLLCGILLRCGSAFWCCEIWHVTIASDHDIGFRAIPPILYCGLLIGGLAFLSARRRWMRGYWRSAVAIIGGASTFAVLRLADSHYHGLSA